jgi:hypothetical protein
MNALYEKMWLYDNLFQPVMHLQEKICQHDKVVRHWDQAQTPYERLVATATLSGEQQTRLQALYEQTNPLTFVKRCIASWRSCGRHRLWPSALHEELCVCLKKGGCRSQ